MSKQLDDDLLVLTLTNQLPVTASSAITSPPYNVEGGSTETWPTPAPYNNDNVHMGDTGDGVTAELYRE